MIGTRDNGKKSDLLSRRKCSFKSRSRQILAKKRKVRYVMFLCITLQACKYTCLFIYVCVRGECNGDIHFAINNNIYFLYVS